MPERLTILCPITSRGCSPEPELQPLFDSLLPSMRAHDLFGAVELIIGFDSDDPLWSQRKVRDLVHDQVRWIELHGLDGNLTTIWNTLERMSRPWSYLLPANDDLAIETNPMLAIETIKRRNDFGLCGFVDSAFPDLATFYVIGQTHREIFDALYPVPWRGAHQDSWIADVYRPWSAASIDRRIKVHNHHGTGPRFEYGEAVGYRDAVVRGRKQVNQWLLGSNHEVQPLNDHILETTSFIL